MGSKYVSGARGGQPRRRRWPFIAALLVVALLGAAAWVLIRAPWRDRSPIRVLADRDSPFHAGYSQWGGPDVLLLEELARDAGRPLEWIALDSMPDLFPSHPDLARVSVLLDVERAEAQRLGFRSLPGLRQPRPGVLLHPDRRRAPDRTDRHVVVIPRIAGYASWATQALAAAGRWDVRTARTRSEAERLFEANRKVGVFLYPEVDGIVVGEEQARDQQAYDDALRFFPLDGKPGAVPVAFAAREHRLAERYEKLVARLAASGDVDRFVRLPPPKAEIERSESGETYTLDAVLPLPYAPDGRGAGLTYAKESLWLAHDTTLYRILLDGDGMPQTEAAISYSLPLTKHEDAHGVAWDGADGLWIASSGFTKLGHYAPLGNPKRDRVVALGERVTQYGLELHEGRLHVVGYSGEIFSFDPARPRPKLQIDDLDTMFWGLESHAGKLYACTPRELYVISGRRLSRVALRADHAEARDGYEALAIAPETGVLYIATRSRLLRFLPGDRNVEVRVVEPPPELPPPAPPSPLPPIGETLVEVESVSFPGEPVALARRDEDEWLAASRIAPWGMMRLQWRGGALISASRLFEDRQVAGLAMLGNLLVIAANDGRGNARLSVLDPAEDFAVRQSIALDELPTGLAADAATGRIWTCSRANTMDDPQVPQYVTYDSELRETARAPAPHRGCQGLSWDGRRLWAVDVFSDALLAVEVGAKNYRVSSAWELPNQYPSAVLVEGNDIWVGDYQTRRVHRFRKPGVSSLP